MCGAAVAGRFVAATRGATVAFVLLQSVFGPLILPRSLLLGFCVVVSVLFAGTPVHSSGPAAENILFVSFDTTRADRLSAYGYSQPTSPELERLASQGVLFERAYTNVPSTLPAHATMFTGRLPAAHGVRCNGKFSLPAAETTLAEILKTAGFSTGAVVAGFPLDPRFGIAQGFDDYDANFSASDSPERKGLGDDGSEFWIGHNTAGFERRASQVTERAIRWLSGVDGRWFLFVHYFDPHTPYSPDADRAERFPHPYDAEISSMDAAFGRLLRFVSELPGRTLVVATSDHGEGLGDHGEAHHNRYLYDSTLRVPLVVSLEGTAQPGHRVHRNVAHVDLFPTLLELAGVPVPGPVTGRSLVALLRGQSLPERPVFAETLIRSLERPEGIEVRALIQGSEKLIRTDQIGVPRRLELYDRASDPGELSNRSVAAPARAQMMAARLAVLQQEAERDAGTPEPFEFDEETRERLKSLGYL